MSVIRHSLKRARGLSGFTTTLEYGRSLFDNSTKMGAGMPRVRARGKQTYVVSRLVYQRRTVFARGEGDIVLQQELGDQRANLKICQVLADAAFGAQREGRESVLVPDHLVLGIPALRDEFQRFLVICLVYAGSLVGRCTARLVRRGFVEHDND